MVMARLKLNKDKSGADPGLHALQAMLAARRFSHVDLSLSLVLHVCRLIHPIGAVRVGVGCPSA